MGISSQIFERWNMQYLRNCETINRKFYTKLPFIRDTSWVVWCAESNNPYNPIWRWPPYWKNKNCYNCVPSYVHRVHEKTI